MRDDVVLQLCEVSKHYRSAGFGGIASGHIPVLENVSLTLHKGETLVLLGRSGAGKTTLARCILRLETIQSGTICSSWGLIAGKSAGKSEQSEQDGQKLLGRRELYGLVQMVPQATSNSLNPFWTMRQTLTAILSSIDKHRSIEEILTLSGLEPSLLSRKPHQLSGGQCQRLLLARALSMNPKIIIFDEPVSSLDLSIQARILNTLFKLREQCGLSYLFITHDLDIANYVSDRIALVENGMITIRGA